MHEIIVPFLIAFPHELFFSPEQSYNDKLSLNPAKPRLSKQKVNNYISALIPLIWFHCIIIITLLFLDSGDRHWIGMWWGGFLICGASLIAISIPFFFFPKELKVISSLRSHWLNDSNNLVSAFWTEKTLLLTLMALMHFQQNFFNVCPFGCLKFIWFISHRIIELDLRSDEFAMLIFLVKTALESPLSQCSNIWKSLPHYVCSLVESLRFAMHLSMPWLPHTA